MATMEERLGRLEDETAIRDLAARFADICIRADHAGFRALWSPSGEWRIAEPFALTAVGIDEIAGMLRGLRDGRDFFVQFVTSGVVALDGSRAMARWVVREVARGPGAVFYDNFALYEDAMEKADGLWRFTHRSCRYLFLDTAPFGGDGFALPHDGV